MITYQRKINYYETDKMGIVHHSNYVRFMEEARVYYLDTVGYSFFELESRGILSPVVEVNVQYKSPCAFNDDIIVETTLTHYSGVRLEFHYIMRLAATNMLLVEATSRHCFTLNGRVCSLAHAAPDIHKGLCALQE